MISSRPLIGISTCRRDLEPHFFHIAGEKYIDAVLKGAGGVPVLIPAVGDVVDPGEFLVRLDGLLLTGSPSNVEPRQYAGRESDPGTLHDPHRDATTLPLIRAAVAAGVPVFAVCRGFQEMNVAFGGTLHQKVHEVPGMQDHREDLADPLDVQYGPAHAVTLAAGGLLARLAGTDRAMVNSLHGQGVDRLGQGLVVEALAPDGMIEAFRVAGAATFAVGVQWHPEWRVLENPFSLALFRAFGEACREYGKRRI